MLAALTPASEVDSKERKKSIAYQLGAVEEEHLKVEEIYQYFNIMYILKQWFWTFFFSTPFTFKNMTDQNKNTITLMWW